MKEEAKIELSDEVSNIIQDWKGIYFKSNNKEYSINTDGLTNQQKQIIVESLQTYPSLLS